MFLTTVNQKNYLLAPILRTTTGGGPILPLSTLTSVEEESKSEVLLYPNSVQTTLSISSEEGNYLRILNSIGQQVYATTTTGFATTVDCSSFPNGVYSVVLRNAQGSKQANVVVLR